jgi:hypothetical protein
VLLIVGDPTPGCELKIDHQAGRDKEGEGEVCFRGRHIMMVGRCWLTPAEPQLNLRLPTG